MKYLNISKNGTRALRYRIKEGEDSEDDIILEPLVKHDVEVGKNFYKAMKEMKVHGSVPAFFTKKENMERIENMMCNSVKSLSEVKENDKKTEDLEKLMNLENF